MILVTGAGGMVGSHLLDQFADDELIRTDLTGSADEIAFDVRDRAQVMKLIGDARPITPTRATWLAR